MATLSVIYPKQSGTFFDLDYYLHKHVPMVKAVLTPMGLQDLQLLRGTESLSGPEPIYQMTALLTFRNSSEIRDALAQHGKQIVEDVPNFTDMKPAIQLNDSINPKPERE